MHSSIKYVLSISVKIVPTDFQHYVGFIIQARRAICPGRYEGAPLGRFSVEGVSSELARAINCDNQVAVSKCLILSHSCSLYYLPVEGGKHLIFYVKCANLGSVVFLFIHMALPQCKNRIISVFIDTLSSCYCSMSHLLISIFIFIYLLHKIKS